MYLFITTMTLLVVITAVPVLIVATAMRARHTSFIAIIAAVTLQALLVHAIDSLIPLPFAAVPLQVIVGGVLFMMVLGTTWPRGVGLAALCVLAAVTINSVTARFVGEPSMLAGF